MTEEQAQRAIAQYLRLSLQPDWMWFHIPNGESRSPRTGARLKQMGVLPGVPDIQILSPSGKAHFLEIKTPKGRLSRPQRAFRDWCEGGQVPFAVVRSIDEARTALRAWGVPGS